MILPFLFVGPSAAGGRGMFTRSNIETDTVIEISPVIVMIRTKGSCLIRRSFTIIFLNGEVKETVLHGTWLCAVI